MIMGEIQIFLTIMVLSGMGNNEDIGLRLKAEGQRLKIKKVLSSQIILRTEN